MKAVKKTPVLVVGCGVSGLTTAVQRFRWTDAQCPCRHSTWTALGL